jgi:hypothetical protein
MDIGWVAKLRVVQYGDPKSSKKTAWLGHKHLGKDLPKFLKTDE